jgi:hypothetical protein
MATTIINTNTTITKTGTSTTIPFGVVRGDYSDEIVKTKVRVLAGVAL